MPRLSTTSLESKFQSLRANGEGALVAYLTGGDPGPKEFLRNAMALGDGGADIIEIGIPFSDPIADGPVIQTSSQRALASGTTPKTVLGLANELSQTFPETPLVLLTYYNPILAMGLDKFMEQARRAGVSGIVVPDLPAEESLDYRTAALRHGVDTIFLAAPNTSGQRLVNIVRKTSGFVYLVSLYGVTGPRENLGSAVFSTVKKVKGISGNVPIAAGFGISRPEHVASLIEAGADGAIVGSALVRIVSENLDGKERTSDILKEKTLELKRATRGKR